MEHPHAHSLLGLRGQGPGEPVSDLIVLEDVVVEVDPTLRPCDGREPVFVSVRTVPQQREPVPLTQWRIADPPQDPFQSGTARGNVVRDGEVIGLELMILRQDGFSLFFGLLSISVGVVDSPRPHAGLSFAALADACGSSTLTGCAPSAKKADESRT